MAKPLAGLNILVTRPAHQAGDLAAGIRTAGGNPVLFPALEILDVADLHPLLDLIARLDEFDLAIFVSPNAVDKAMPLILAHRQLPSGLKIAVVGKGSTKELQHFGVSQVIAPTERFDSEALLATAELQQMQGKRVAIFRGDGGRELLGNTLVQRGAMLEYAECYRRRKPDADLAPLLQAAGHGRMHAITVTSSEGLRNLCEMAGEPGKQQLRQIPLFVSHARIGQIAKKLGLAHVIVTAAGDEGLLQGLLNYFREAGGSKRSML